MNKMSGQKFRLHDSAIMTANIVDIIGIMVFGGAIIITAVWSVLIQ